MSTTRFISNQAGSSIRLKTTIGWREALVRSPERLALRCIRLKPSPLQRSLSRESFRRAVSRLSTERYRERRAAEEIEVERIRQRRQPIAEHDDRPRDRVEQRVDVNRGARHVAYDDDGVGHVGRFAEAGGRRRVAARIERLRRAGGSRDDEQGSDKDVCQAANA